MSFIEEFKNRGYFYQCTDIEKLTQLMESHKIAAYIGFDCTARSLHAGSLMQIMILRLLQQHGHKPIVILGGATSKIGDPTGKDEARKTLTNEELEENTAGIKKSLSKFIRFGTAESDAILVNNNDWLEQLNYIGFLRDFGAYFSVNRMITMDSVKLRLEREQHLSFLEFNYMLLQAYDFYHLNKTYNCSLQIGGSDQWGNIVMGADFIRKLTSREAYGLTTPLLTTASGNKMGKSVGGAVWLNEDCLSPYDYYQYWRNCEDLDVVRFASLYSELTTKELEAFKHLANSNINEAKKQLAFNLTKLCHSEEAAINAHKTAIKTFELKETSTDLPTIFIDLSRLKTGIPAYELFFESGLSASKSDARRLIRGLGARLNNQAITDENMVINASHMLDGNIIKLSAGKKKHIVIRGK